MDAGFDAATCTAGSDGVVIRNNTGLVWAGATNKKEDFQRRSFWVFRDGLAVFHPPLS